MKNLLLMVMLIITTGCTHKFFDDNAGKIYPVVYKKSSSAASWQSATGVKTDFTDFLYVKINNRSVVNSDLLEDIVMSAFSNSAVFKRVVTKSPTIYINAKPREISETKTGKLWHQRVNPLSIKEIREQYTRYERFFIADVTLQQPKTRSLDYNFDIRIMDSATGKVLYHTRTEHTRWYGKLSHAFIDKAVQDIDKWARVHAFTDNDFLAPPFMRAGG